MHTKRTNTPSLLLLALALPAAAQEAKLQFNGAGWVQFGRIEHSSYTGANGGYNDFNKNWNQNTGGQITAVTLINENWEGGLGLGAIQTHGSRGAIGAAHIWAPFWAPYVTEARATYKTAFGGEGEHKLNWTLGAFPYNYNQDAKNLGMYLLRGQVYPGTVISGFETKHVLPIASIFGGLLRYENSVFRNDLILNSETDQKPYFDFSVADVASLKLGAGFEIGAGVNFYRAIPQISKVTSPEKGCESSLGTYQPTNSANNDDGCFIQDTNMVAGSPDPVIDTVFGSLAGTKLMGRFRLDPKAWFSVDAFGKEDLVIYAEAAVLGLKDYPKYYEKISERIPVMIGVNIPTFKLLDALSLEVQYYGSKNYSDYGRTETYSTWIPRVPIWIEEGVTKTVDTKRDDWKWSLYASRVMLGHLKLSAQVANDHLRPGGYGLQPTWVEALSTPEDWYWMCKLAYFF